MDILNTTRKRKKRKTRKCLDQIRKRSRLNTDMTDFHKKNPLDNKQNRIVTKFTGVNRYNNCITSKRITLPLFPKVIKSETVTRAPVVEIKQDPKKLIRDKNDKPQSTVTSFMRQDSPYSDNDIIRKSDEHRTESGLDNSDEVNEIFSQNESDRENVSHFGNNSPSSYILFSPTDRAVDVEVFEDSHSGRTISSATSTSSESSSNSYGYQLYEEFMNEIPAYLKKNTPALIKEDVMKKTKTILNKIYMEGCHRECEDNILQCIKKSELSSHRVFPSSESIIENPVDYIRLGCTWQHNISQKIAENKSTSDDTSAVETADSTHTYACRIPTMSAPSSAHSFIHNTPDYMYYPHKLNH